MRLALHLFAAVLVTAGAIASRGAPLAADESATPWTASTNSKVRLVSGTVDDRGQATHLAGIQLRLEPGWKTYWRNPGDSGVPPSFDWSGSKNLKQAEVLYPMPRRLADAGGVAIGYSDEVLFPVKLIPEREGEPIELKLAFAYGLCKDLCIPNEVNLSLVLPPDQDKGDALLLGEALALTPRPAAAGLPPAIGSIEAKLDGESPTLVIDALFPARATGTDLFIDGGDVFVPVPKPLAAPMDGKERFVVTFPSPAAAAAIKGKTLRLTLVSDQGSTETMWKAE